MVVHVATTGVAQHREKAMSRIAAIDPSTAAAKPLLGTDIDFPVVRHHGR
jgi:hypothetical protein